jgi:hypothetical protein
LTPNASGAPGRNIAPAIMFAKARRPGRLLASRVTKAGWCPFGRLSKPPTSYFKSIWIDTIVPTPHHLCHLIDVYGVDHVLVGTDYLFDMGEMDRIGQSAGLTIG